jgi:hypothetical protein
MSAGPSTTAPPPSDRRERWGGRVPDLFLVVPPQFNLVPVPVGRQQPGGGTAHLNHGVVRRGRPVDEGLQGGAQGPGREPEAARQLRGGTILT